MIRNDTEYRGAIARLQQEARRLEEHDARLKAEGLDEAERKRALDPIRSHHLQLAEDVHAYEKLTRGEVGHIGELLNLRELGRALVAARIARGLSQRDLAARLGVHESQVSRDERNEYHGVTVERASRILDAMGVCMTSRFEPLEPLDDAER